MNLFLTAIVLQAATLQGPQPEATHEPAIVLSAERAWAGADILLPLANSPQQDVTIYAVRALGRLEDPKLVAPLIQLTDTKSEAIRLAAASALAQTIWHVDPQAAPDLIAGAAAAIRRVYAGVPVQASGQALSALGAIAYARPSDVKAAETILADAMDRTRSGIDNGAAYASAVAAFEALTRRNARMPGLAYEPESIDKLSSSVRNEHQNDVDPAVRQNALRALLNARAVDSTVLAAAVKDTDEQVRRIAVQILGGNVFATDADSRFQDVHHAMSDPSLLVRLEAVRSYARRVAATHGCGPLLDSLQDDSTHVMLAAMDALATACPGDEDVTLRLTEEARPAPTTGPWQRETHAYVALAKRDPERAAVVAQSYVTHPSWIVRLYAARAAAAAEDVPRLERLSLDDNDNVREATLAPLRKLKRSGADDVIVADLARRDYQLLRTAALLLKESPINATFAKPLLAALLRVSSDGKETSRDARLALLDALDRHAGPDQSESLMPLTRDVDPKVASRAAEIVSRWIGRSIDAQAIPVLHTAVREFPNLKECVAVTMDNGRRFRLRMDPDAAPISAGRFLKIALEDKYYDGLTFHRVEPNFVVQGGSPGANEYSSDQKYFMRDEIAARNTRGAVGLSTRGRNTGDGQFYVMLVDDPRLDHEYTIFAHVFGNDMDVVDRIGEGDKMISIRSVSCQP